MAQSGGFKYWVSILMSRFARTKNLDGDFVAIERSAIPTATMVANWAKNDREDISEVWVFGSATDMDRWDPLKDDIDMLLVVPDALVNPEEFKEIPKQVPLSDQYMELDIRVKRESECEPWVTLAASNQLATANPEGKKEGLTEFIFRHGVCVWRRADDEKDEPKKS